MCNRKSKCMLGVSVFMVKGFCPPRSYSDGMYDSEVVLTVLNPDYALGS